MRLSYTPPYEERGFGVRGEGGTALPRLRPGGPGGRQRGLRVVAPPGFRSSSPRPWRAPTRNEKAGWRILSALGGGRCIGGAFEPEEQCDRRPVEGTPRGRAR